jgi:hypothetical protein
MIRYLTHQEIDKNKWDNCIEKSPNGLIYGYSWFLDRMTDNWDALVEDNYVAVMPLPWRKKYLFSYIYQPFFTQQLGVFSTHEVVSEQKSTAFISKIPFRFIKVHTQLNFANTLAGKIKTIERKNFYIDLGQPYSEIYKKFKLDVGNQIRNAEKLNITITEDILPETIIELYAQQYQYKISNIGQQDFKRLIELCHYLKSKNQYFSAGIYKNQTLIGAIIILTCPKRAQWMVNMQTNQGREIKTQYLLINYFIKLYAQKINYLDFGGSDIKAIAAFMRKFRPIEEKYLAINSNVFFNLFT